MQKNSNTIYTIGYAAFPEIRDMMSTFKFFDINVLIDVRSIPFSKNFPTYNKPNLIEVCDENQLYYRHYAKPFGARQTDVEFLSDGQVDFDRFAKSDQFQEGIQKMANTVNAGYVPCLLCAEKDPIICHRSILIGRRLMEAGLIVRHIKAGGETETQEELQERLVNTYFKNREQVQIWDEPMSDEDYINEAYIIQNKKIGYRTEEPW